jgi:hypothetical protein
MNSITLGSRKYNSCAIINSQLVKTTDVVGTIARTPIQFGIHLQSLATQKGKKHLANFS